LVGEEGEEEMDDEDCFVIGLAPEQENSATVEDLWQYTAQPEVSIKTFS
jgi:hypothetical protein